MSSDGVPTASDASIRPSVGIAGHGGIPGMPAAASPQKNQADTTSEQLKEVEPSPPPRIGAFVDEVYHKVGAANDIILVEGLDGTLSATDFNVMFSRKVRAKGGKPDAPGSLSTVDKAVHTYVNGELQPQLYMRVRDDGFCTFPDGGLQPQPEALKGKVGLVPGVNNVRFEIRYLRDARVLVAECFAFLWGVHTPVIVMDIDGTITRSDVPGLMMTLSPGIYDHTHSGICGLLTRIASEGAEVMYLTSRPIALAPKTRAFLTSTRQDDVALPLGPLQCCLDKVTGVIWRELVAKNMHEYKMKALLDLSKVFREAGKPFGDSVFAAGIGNKCTDAVAYRAAGIPPDFIFLIDKESHLQVWDGDSSTLGGSDSGRPLSPPHLKSCPPTNQPSPVSITSSASSLRARLSPSRSRTLAERGTRWLFGADIAGGGGSGRRRGRSGGNSGGDDAITKSSSVKSNGSSDSSGRNPGSGVEGNMTSVDSAILLGDVQVVPEQTRLPSDAGGASWMNEDFDGDTAPSPGSLILPPFTPAATPSVSAPPRNADPAAHPAGGDGKSDASCDGTKSASVSMVRDRKDADGGGGSGARTSADEPAALAAAAASSRPSGNGEAGAVQTASAPGQSSAPPRPSVQGVGATVGDAEAPNQPPVGYATYGDERFFHRLRESVKQVRGEATEVVVEAGKHAAENVRTVAHLAAELPILNHREHHGESAEHAEMRLAERVHEFNSTATGHVAGDVDAEASRRPSVEVEGKAVAGTESAAIGKTGVAPAAATTEPQNSENSC